jgi:AcrR family transcriptional regulator
MATANTSETVDVRENIIAVGQRLIGAKGFSAVGLNEILSEAGVPKGSFYHYFGSKDAFGVAMLESYFEEYLDDLDQTLAQPGLNMAQRLMNYWRIWQETQSFFDCQGKCLAVKLGAEVADMSEAMRATLNSRNRQPTGASPRSRRRRGLAFGRGRSAERRTESLPALAGRQHHGQDRSQRATFRNGVDDNAADAPPCSLKNRAANALLRKCFF